MRFMVIVKGNKDSEAGVLPGPKLLSEMGKFNEELIKAGVLLAADGLQASAKGARVTFSGSERSVAYGPFAEPEKLVAGFWIFRVSSLEDAIAWVKRVPFEHGEIEIRQIFEAEDFGPALAEQESGCAKPPQAISA